MAVLVVAETTGIDAPLQISSARAIAASLRRVYQHFLALNQRHPFSRNLAHISSEGTESKYISIPLCSSLNRSAPWIASYSFLNRLYGIFNNHRKFLCQILLYYKNVCLSTCAVKKPGFIQPRLRFPFHP